MKKAEATPAAMPEGSDAIVPAGSSRRRLRMWLVVAAALLVFGTSGSWFAANSVARANANQSRRAFTTASGEVTSTLQLAIERENDLILSGAAYLAANPNGSEAQFRQWSDAVEAMRGYPELNDFGNAVIVPAADLATFAAWAQAHPSAPLGPNGTFVVEPPGPRSYYCLGTVDNARNVQVGAPAGEDFCATGLGSALLAARDSGHGSYEPFTVGGVLQLGVSTPYYRGGGVPSTTVERRAAFLGWFGLSIVPEVVLDRALRGHPNFTATMSYGVGASQATFRAGVAPSNSQLYTTNLHNGWTITTSGAVASAGAFTYGPALALLLSGAALSAVLAAMVLILATGRARALRLVGDKTGELRYQSLHDPLTGLPNRALIADRIEQLLARNRRNGSLGAALYVDLDEFKNVNDTLGHGAGDKLLQAVAGRLTTSLRDADTIGRMGGDEFVVLIEGVAEPTAPELVAERILEVMRQPFELEETATPIVVTASIGIAIGDRDIPGELLRDADVALYQAKASGKNCYELFRPEMDTHIQRRFDLEFDLRGALADRQFRLVYQPIYNLDDLTLTGVEALIRWQHPTLGEIQPGEFIPLLESSGQICEVGHWVLQEACRQMAAWRALGTDLTMSVNVSGRQLDRDTIIDDVREALETSGLDPVLLTIEVTETALMRNVELTARRLQDLKALGVQIAIDDFGTGYSSLAYLRRFPVDCLKIDRSFTEAINQSRDSDVLVHTLVQLGRDLGLKTLAEGVETIEQVDHLRREHVSEAQGFLLARPLDPRSLESQLLEPARPTETPSTTPR